MSIKQLGLACSWMSTRILDISGVKVLVNCDDGKSDYIVDVSEVFSSIAKKYPVEKRIYVATEPTPYLPGIPDQINDFYKKAIMGWHECFKKYQQFKQFEFGTSWVTWETSIENKRFGISGVFSGKNDSRFPGYALRKEIIARQNEIKIPGIIYSPVGYWNGQVFKYPIESKKPTFDWMFHLSVENIPERGYFSEKLIDALVSYCIPVYFGDPDIGNTFDINGFIILDRNNWVNQINNLTEQDFISRKEFAKKNFDIAQKYRGLENNICKQIISKIN